ncbi:hypothetical protein [Sinomonas halotolerans]|uniref:DUF2384 domain-containing protein n=1 Tax=Sinomonas halotolerans TaxID=1644133 RepID=A0ABU9WW26_9MICC
MTTDAEGLSPRIARALRDEEEALGSLERECGRLDAAQVEALFGLRPGQAEELCGAGQLLAYRHRGAQTRWYPAFQFDGPRVLAVVAHLLEVARAAGVAHEDVVLWLGSRTAMLSGTVRPVDLLRTDPQSVLAAARYDLAERAW